MKGNFLTVGPEKKKRSGTTYWVDPDLIYFKPKGVRMINLLRPYHEPAGIHILPWFAVHLRSCLPWV